MSELPKGWLVTTLGDVADWASGGTPRSTEPSFYDGGIPWLIIGDLNDGLVTRSARTISQAGFENSSTKWVEKGAILVAMYGSIGKLGIAGVRCTTNQAIAFTTRISGAVEPRYLFLYLTAARASLLGLGKGGAQANISQAVLKAFALPLAPLAEQRRIVAKLDALLGRLDACRQHIDKVPRLLARFRQSVLAAACAASLTAEWRRGHADSSAPTTETESGLPGSWSERSLGELVEDGPHNGLYKPQSAYGQGMPIVRIDSFYDGVIAPFHTLKRVQATVQEREQFHLRDGDLLINRVNSLPFLGKVGLVRGLLEPTLFESNMMRLRFDTRLIDVDYVVLYLRSAAGIQELRKNAKHAVNQASINQQDVKAVRVPLPPLEEQREIVRRVDQLFAFADRLEARVQTARKRVDAITQSILGKAFRGELVPQDANDQPAVELLERSPETFHIGLEHPRTAGKRPRAPRENAAMTKSRHDDDVNGKPYLAGLLRTGGYKTGIEDLFRLSELPVVDFYKQLSWEVEVGLIRNEEKRLEPA